MGQAGQPGCVQNRLFLQGSCRTRPKSWGQLSPAQPAPFSWTSDGAQAVLCGCRPTAHPSFPRGPFTCTFKANKTFIVQIFFFSFFSFLQKHAYIHRVWWSWGRHTRVHTHTHSLTLSHTNTFLLGPRPGPQKPRRRCQGSIPSPVPPIHSPTPFPLSQASPM